MRPRVDRFSAFAMLCAIASLGLWLACAGTAPALAAPTQSPTDPASATQPPQRLTGELAERLVGELIPAVESLRQLAFLRPVPVRIVDEAGARRHARDRLETFQARERMVETGRAYELLGLLPKGSDVLDLYLDAFDEQAGGFYDPSSGSYFLLDRLPAALAPSVTVHELTHALEDQHYDLDRRMREVADDDDRLFAVSAVHEGSAMLTMGAFLVRRILDGESDLSEMASMMETQADAAAALRRLPPVLLRQMTGPYFLGTSFLTRGRGMTVVKDYPVADVNRAYEDGPVSSEQILHPERYWDEERRDDPVAVTLDGAGEVLGSRWTRCTAGVLGEITLGLLVGAPTPDDWATAAEGASWTNEAADGWDGDRWELWTRGDRAVVILGTIWDTTDDADEFAAALPVSPTLNRLVSGRRVALVAGRLGKKRLRALLSAIVEP